MEESPKRFRSCGFCLSAADKCDGTEDHRPWQGRYRLPSLPRTDGNSTALYASCHAAVENVTLAAVAEGVQFFKVFLKEYGL